MGEVLLEVRLVGGEQLRVVVDHQQVFGVARLGLFREIEAPRNDRPPVDQYDLVVGDRMLSVDEAGDVGVGDDVRGGVVVLPVPL